LILASRSPQRKAILEQLGVAFTVAAPGVEELRAGEPHALVEENALRKARSVQSEELVLGADTAVVIRGRVHGKPCDRAEAERFLRELCGREHEVMSGIALRDARGERSAVAVTLVRFRALGERELGWYLASGEWEGRAGGYAIQGKGAALVERIEGCYWNVVGLPVAALLELEPDLIAAPRA